MRISRLLKALPLTLSLPRIAQSGCQVVGLFDRLRDRACCRAPAPITAGRMGTRFRHTANARAAFFLAGAIATVGCADSGTEHDRHVDRARAHIAASQFEMARVDILNALRISPRSVEASLLGAQVSIELSEWRRAAQFFQNVLQEAPHNVESLVGLARIYVLAAQPEEALPLTERALAGAPDHPDALVAHASALARQGAYASAMVHVNSALRVAPDNEEALALLAYLLERSGQGDAALDTLKAAIERRPDSERLIQSLSELALALRRFDVAVNAQQRLLELDPGNRDAHHQLARLLLHDGRYDDAQHAMRQYLEINPSDVTARLFLTESLSRQGRHDDAHTSLAHFLTERDDVPELRLLLANLMERRGDTDAALAAYRASIRAQGESVVALTARNNVARILIGRGEDAAARAILDEVFARNAADVEALTLSGYLRLRAGDALRATAELRAAREGGGEGFVSTLLAQSLWAQGDHAAAIAEIKDHPDAPQAGLLLARFLLGVEDFSGAARQVDALLHHDPLSVAAHEINVELALRDGDFERAFLSSQVIMDVFEDGALGYHLAARVDHARGRRHSARQFARRALELSPDAVEPLELLVKLHLADDDTDAARLALATVIEARPGHAIAHWWRGRVAMADGALDAAAADFERARAASPRWSRPWLWGARLAMAQGRGDEARAILDAGLEATNSAATLVALQADFDRASGDVNAAIERYRVLLHRAPESQGVVNNLAMLLVDAQRGAQDLVEARTLIARLIPGDNPRVHDTIGQVMARTCAWEKAEASFRQAVALNPDHAPYQLRLARALLAQLDTRAASDVLGGVDIDLLAAPERAEHQQLVAHINGASDVPCTSLTAENQT